jgi:hypothetical protein
VKELRINDAIFALRPGDAGTIFRFFLTDQVGFFMQTTFWLDNPTGWCVYGEEFFFVKMNTSLLRILKSILSVIVNAVNTFNNVSPSKTAV